MKSIRAKHLRRLGVVVLLSALGLAPAAVSLAGRIPGKAHPVTRSSLPDGMSWRTYHLMMAQAPLDAAATKIQALAARQGPAHRGFFETAVNDSRRVLTVYWHGPVPGTVRRLIGRLRSTVSIRVVQTRYSLAALNRDVLTAIRSGRKVTGGWPLTDGGGIVLNVNSPNLRQVATAMRSRFGVPVMITPGGADQPQTCAWPASNAHLGPGSRCWDLEPFWGGDVIQSSYGNFCTGGFGVHNSTGGEYLITAAHCADNHHGYVNGITFYNGQDPSHWQVIGQITDVPGPHDLAVIPTGTGNRYYDGPGIYNGDTYGTKIVAGQQATSVGDWLCESGSFGGTLCDFQVQYLNASVPDDTYPSHIWTSLALATSPILGNYPDLGDSGGPWFTLDGCCTRVWAKGIHHGLYSTPSGFYDVFTPITVATSDLGVWVNTG